MEAIFQQYNFNGLRLHNEQKLLFKLQPTDFKRGTGKNAIRKIFSEVQYDLFEQQQLSMFRKDVDSELPDDVILRLLYANQFDVGLTQENIEKHRRWLENAGNFKFSLSAEDLLVNGAFYIAGRGKCHKPIIVVNSSIIDIQRYSMEDISRALVIILMIVKKYMFEPGLVENWIVLVEAKESSANNIPFNHLAELFSMLRINFPCYLDRLFILSPKTSVQVIWQIVEQFIPHNSRHKIEFVSNGSIAMMQNYITMDQIQIRHGGKMPNIYDYWPPTILHNEYDFEQEYQREMQEVQKKLMIMKNLLPFSSRISEEVQNILKKKHKPKNKVYKEETYVDHSEYYRSKQASKTIFLDQVKNQETAKALSVKQEESKPLIHSRFIPPQSKPREELSGFRFYKSTINQQQFGAGTINKSLNVSVINKSKDVFERLHDSQFI